ncbi:MAG: helix-turn-helix domain-containing protein [Pseudonocardia sp.]|nr:helix-turn-helix domain-containing protein [Pseudonocardia sp.]
MERTPPLQTIAAAIRRERARMGISSAELARRAGIAKSTLSQLEAATGNPSVETLWAIAVVADVPFSTLVDPPPTAVRVIRAGAGPAIRSESSPFTSLLLSAGSAGSRRDLHLITSAPGEPRTAEAHSPGTTEHMLVSQGRWTAGPAGEEVELDPGDYVTFPADRPHSYRALTGPASAALIMEYQSAITKWR